MTDKDEKIFRYIKLRIQENFLTTWYTIYQHCCNFAVPILLLLIYVNRLVAFQNGSSGLDLSKVVARAQNVERFDLMGDSESLQIVFQEAASKGMLTFDYYEAVLSFLIFWYFFSSTFVNVFSLLYYRKFV